MFLPSQRVCAERQDRVATRQVRHPALAVPSQFPQARSRSHEQLLMRVGEGVTHVLKYK